jgi:tRNA(Ile)-lysidine synthase
MEKINSQKIIAVSGGVDSMFLLNQFKDENVIVAHVNYNIREDVEVDLNIVTKFCKENNLKLEVLSLNEDHSGNFHE